MRRAVPAGTTVAAALAAVGVVGYRRWLAERYRRASVDSSIAQTALGPVEYDRRGRGPIVVHFHGGNVGHQGWFVLAHLVDAGFDLITPDRPGYLGTPLDGHGEPEAQADVVAALLDALGIDRVGVVGVSAGGPGAVEFAVRHPDRTSSLVLLSALTRGAPLNADQLESALGRLVMSPAFQDPAYFLVNQTMRRFPRLALRSYLRTETTYDPEEGAVLINHILADPRQTAQVAALAEAIVPARPRLAGVMNDLAVQQRLAGLPLAEVAAPTLVVHSHRDGDVPIDNAQLAHAQIPDCELVTVAQFGHLLWWGDPRVTSEIEERVRAFLVDPTARTAP